MTTYSSAELQQLAAEARRVRREGETDVQAVFRAVMAMRATDCPTIRLFRDVHRVLTHGTVIESAGLKEKWDRSPMTMETSESAAPPLPNTDTDYLVRLVRQLRVGKETSP